MTHKVVAASVVYCEVGDEWKGAADGHVGQVVRGDHCTQLGGGGVGLLQVVGQGGVEYGPYYIQPFIPSRIYCI